MKIKKYLVSVLYIVIGAILLALGFAGKVDEFWNGMGSALLVIGVIQFVRFYRFEKNEAYREKIETEANDERNHFIRNKAWAWTGYIYILITSLLVIIFKIFGYDMLSYIASIASCSMLILYWIMFIILKRK